MSGLQQAVAMPAPLERPRLTVDGEAVAAQVRILRLLATPPAASVVPEGVVPEGVVPEGVVLDASTKQDGTIRVLLPAPVPPEVLAAMRSARCGCPGGGCGADPLRPPRHGGRRHGDRTPGCFVVQEFLRLRRRNS